MSWIESHQSLARHRKTLQAVAALHCDRHKLLGHLHELWWWGLDNADSDGLIGHAPPEAIAEAAGWPVRDADRFVGAIQAAGFLERGEAGFVLHDWFDYAGKLNVQRAKNKVRMFAARAAHKNGTSGARAPATGPDQPDLPPVGPLSSTSPARARDAAPGPAARAAPLTRKQEDEPSSLRPEQQQCPMCPEVFPDNGALRDHLDNSPRHKVRPVPEDFSGNRSRSSAQKAEPETPPDIAAELAALATRPRLKPEDLPPDIAAEHERLLAQEHARNGRKKAVADGA